ncbi:hypothetical protein C8R42DRAFT_691489 [Lentinula raphanica]|nr:hypothetical protein C8R42DRAFT_691489 [Lentinula raphanica]
MSKKGTKGSKAEVSSYEVADIVLGKLRGYPPWPGRVVDPDSVQHDVEKERPSVKKGIVYCVQFFPTGDHAWLGSKDISKLKPNEIETYIAEHSEGRRSADLLQGYKVARDPREWIKQMSEKEAAKADDDEADADEDEEDELADDSERHASGTKKKSTTSASAVTKKRKRNSEPAKGKTTTTKPKGASRGRKSKAAIESEDDEDGAHDAQAENKSAAPASPPPAKKAKTVPTGKEENPEDAELAKDPEATKVREWRHKLQKVFLSNKVQAPKQEDMPDMDDLFTQIETYDKINIAYLSFSKIGKVMRHITALSDDKVPLDSQYKFRDRAKVLVERWQHIINASRADGKEKDKESSATRPPAVMKNSDAGTPNGVGSKASPGETPHSPSALNNDGENKDVNGVADAINTSIATGTMEEGENGDETSSSGKVNGHFKQDTSAMSVDTHEADISILPDITMSEIGGE